VPREKYKVRGCERDIGATMSVICRTSARRQVGHNSSFRSSPLAHFQNDWQTNNPEVTAKSALPATRHETGAFHTCLPDASEQSSSFVPPLTQGSGLLGYTSQS
jgi:hypothetical protein